MFDHDADDPNVTSWLVYDPNAPNPEPAIISQFYDWNDTALVPLTPIPVTNYDSLVSLEVNFTSIDGINYAIVNNNSYLAPNVPAMLTALTTGAEADNPAVYGNTTNSFVLNHLDMVWLTISNFDTGGHPCNSPLISRLIR